MARADGKKRKAPADSAVKSTKRVAVDGRPTKLKVTKVIESGSQVPLFYDAPELEVPADLVFHERDPKSDERAKQVFERERVWTARSHPVMNYTLREVEEPGLTYWLGIVDPKTGEVELIRSKRAELTTVVRARDRPAEATEEKGASKSMLDLKADLSQTFGTKKAKKAIEQRVLNAIPSQKKANGQTIEMDDASRAILQSVGENVADMSTQQQLQAVVDEAKPRPIANVDADDIQDVYAPGAIIGDDILQMLPIREWQEKARRKENIQTTSRYVAARISALAANDAAEERLRVLRYLSFALAFYRETKSSKKREASVPTREKLRESLAPAPEAVIENLRRKFSDRGQIRKFHTELLITHICAFACIVDNFEVATHELQLDLGIDDKTMNQYFREIGARIKPVSGREHGGRATSVARMTLPLEFPKQRKMKQKQRR
ncbi:RNA polymerase I associated factor [Cordyceps fumosorosea ARSEF 2679]|uniref:RNA polymerase I associated factor n=1 Tax=Cordyceps fumosorosea (strain ARSEF 2679) TaxID=1081104 RepID=A0A168CEF1_CORFA|nr:RNA polymerase I associated factor [Cordyceps fumosorosea ARSEF 2679]OAA71278.1 RNA polymerase I associated factor [Cordyceps fumosorosea ARSEF 2679]